MKINKHANGTYSITEMTGNDVTIISSAMAAGAAHPAFYNGIDDVGIKMLKATQAAQDRFWYVLYALERSAGSGSIEVTSADCYGDDDAVMVVKVNNVAGYRGENGEREDITSALPRKGMS